MEFEWVMFGRWMLVAFILLALSFLLLGLPGAIIYEGWRIVLNTLFQREVMF